MADVLVVEPYLFEGQPVELTLHLKATSPDQVGNIKGRLSGAGEALRRVNPLSGRAVSMASNIFEGVVGVFVSASRSWRFRFTLHPVGARNTGDGELLTEGRHVFVYRPPATVLPSFDPAVLVES